MIPVKKVIQFVLLTDKRTNKLNVVKM